MSELDNIQNTEKYKNLPQRLKNAMDFLFTSKSVFNVRGDEFPDNGENFTSLINRIAKFYEENYNSKIIVDNFGTVLLDRKSVKNTSYHHFNKNKINAFAAVPYVLKAGKIADYIENYKNKNEDRYLFIAPITIEGEDFFCEVVIKATDRQSPSGVKRFYLHEVEKINKLVDVFLTSCGGTSTSSKSIIANLIHNFNKTGRNFNT